MAAGRCLGERLAAELPEMAADIGISAGRVVASERAVELAQVEGSAEAAQWELGDTTTLRGRTAPTRIAVPRAPAHHP